MAGNAGLGSGITGNSVVSVLQQATLGANDPAQSTSTQQGFYEAPNALFRAMNQNSVTDLTVLSSGSVGSFLQSKKIVNGNMATIINATLDYTFGGQHKKLPAMSPSVKSSTAGRTFIPIIIKTDFNYTTVTVGQDTGQSRSTAVPTPLYIVFDSTPDDITFTKAANWAQKDFLGRPEPIWTYQHSSATTFSLIGKFYAESFEVHGRILKLSDYIMSLVTPSEMNYMPSPVTVFIGQWKELRCIVTNISISFKGPWSVQVSNADLAMAETQESADRISTVIANQATKTVPSHAPYYFEATFNFTMVGKDNTVQYAEQVISGDSGFSNSSDPLTAEFGQESGALEKAASYLTQEKPASNINTGLYAVQSETKYTFTGGVLRTAINSSTRYTEAAESLNIYANANAINRLSDQGVISNALNSQMLSLFQKANPTSTNTPQTTTSLNPFKKLF